MTSAAGFLSEPPVTPAVQALYDDDAADPGFVMNVSRLWAYQPATAERFFALMSDAFAESELSFRRRALLVLATASTLGDSYCSLAWGHKLSAKGGADAAAGVLSGTDVALDDAERALVRWARRVVDDPNATTSADVELLREVGFTDRQIFAVTTYVAMRLAFSTINDALGATPDAALLDLVPGDVRDAVGYGRRS